MSVPPAPPAASGPHGSDRPATASPAWPTPPPVRAPAGAHGRDVGPSRGRPLVDRRGLTAVGATVLQLVLTGGGAGLDALVGRQQLWLLFTVGFVLGAGLTAQRVHREDLGTAVMLPPLVFAVVVSTVSVLTGRSDAGGRQHLLDAGTALVTHAPLLLAGVLLALAVAIVRRLHERRSG